MYSDAIFASHRVGIGVMLLRRLSLAVEGSYLFPLFGDEYHTGDRSLTSAFPKGFLLGGSIGYYFPFIQN